MILQALCDYYQRQLALGQAPKPGFEFQGIHFVVVIHPDGSPHELTDVRQQGKGNKLYPQTFEVPQSCKRPGVHAWKTAFLLWDNSLYTLGIDLYDQPEKTQAKHQSFIDTVEHYFQPPDTDEGIEALKRFLTQADWSPLKHSQVWQELKKQSANVAFRLVNAKRLICQSAVVTQKAAQQLLDRNMLQGRCLITGRYDTLTRLHPAIKGVPYSQPTGSNIVSFNANAFTSYSLPESWNAPTSAQAAFEYTTALNLLFAPTSHQRLTIKSLSLVFWAQKPNWLETTLSDLFGWAPKDDPDRPAQAVKALYESPYQGRNSSLSDDTMFYVLGIQPNRSRLAVALWYQTTVQDLAHNIRRYFEELSIIKPAPDSGNLPVSRLIESVLATEDNEAGERLTADTIWAIITDSSFPSMLYAQAIQRCQRERRVTYPRAAVIKACLNRFRRLYQPDNLKEGITMELARDYTDIGYCLGRLFAALEKIQENANPSMEATVRERYYSAASTRPLTVFPNLMRLKNYHMDKLSAPSEAYFEKLVGEIVSLIDHFPASLNLTEQGQFAIGYYHQRQQFYQPQNSEKEDQ